ncbi:hypothetical protein ACFQU9_01975 [Actinomadura namibiensis]|uniref:Uncharacterized protein n=1 Tax=Actinomadura namibiensis TaxID=182080 RepID=A0A7W3QL27_ACTNM|nr:hypothetical protein [Actinomadura namibiensis]MBA8951027.1 hypothetical protein [Actinomadura namibiensis]
MGVVVPPTPHLNATFAGGVVCEGAPVTVTDLKVSAEAAILAVTVTFSPATTSVADGVAVTVTVAASAPNAGSPPAASTAAVPSPTMIGFPADRGSTAPAPPSRHH